MLIVVALKTIREIVADSLKLRRELLKRYPGLIAE